MTDQYAVFGNPVEHSKSPRIHTLFARQTMQDMAYGKQHVELSDFIHAVREFIRHGGKGLNITVPFKEQAYALADTLSERAQKAGAVNTLAVQPDGSLYGDNTDGAGLLRDITVNLGWQITGKNILVLGAGGAVRGILAPLMVQQPASVIIANRTVEKAKQLAALFAAEGNISACGFQDIPQQPFDIIINGTSASLSGNVPPLPVAAISAQTHCYDMMYGNELTPFLRWAEKMGAGFVADGLGMLVEQAAEAFCLWRGVMPQTEVVINALCDN